MRTTGPVFVVDYTDRTYEEVGAALDAWTDSLLSTRPVHRPIARVGATDRITDHVARVMMFDPDALDGAAFAELRVIAVSTGHEALTELLVYADPRTNTAAARAAAVLRARSILDGAMQRLELAHQLWETQLPTASNL
jgi:hypothetical protein